MTKYVGKPIPRYDGIGHVTGATAYVDDINMPGMLYAKVLRSPVPKGVIRRIDVSGAENLPGSGCRDHRQGYSGEKQIL